MPLSRRQELVLAALAARSGASFAPVQVQKLFFLIDANLADQIGGKQFKFEPYDYGPFDKEVYHELDSLMRSGLVQVSVMGTTAGSRRYSLTPDGQDVGEGVLKTLNAKVQDYISRLIDWLRTLSFAELVGSIYQAYPEMRANSIFKG